MKNYFSLTFTLLILVPFFAVFPQDFVEIKSLQTYAGNNQISIPIVNRSNPRKSNLTIEFDVDADTAPLLEIRFNFCNKNWIPEDNIFLNSPFRNYANNQIGRAHV